MSRRGVVQRQVSPWGRRLAVAASLTALATTSGCTYAAVAIAGVLASSSDSSSGRAAAPAPIVIAVSPAQASHAGGEQVEVLGSHFMADSTVFVGDTPASEVRYDHPGCLVVTLPRVEASGPQAIQVIGANGRGTLAGAVTLTNTPPTASVRDLGGALSGNLLVAFTLYDAEADPVDVELEFGVDGVWVSQNSHVVSGDLSGLESSPQGVEHTVTIDTTAAFPRQNLSALELRVTLRDSLALPGDSVTSNTFALTNNLPLDLRLDDPNDDSYHVVLRLRIANVESDDAVQLTDLRWHDIDQGTSGPLTVVSGQGLGSVASSPSGAESVVIWDSQADLGYGNGRLVRLSATASDGYAQKTTSTTPFLISNGPLSTPEALNTTGAVQSLGVGDVNSDTRPDVVYGTLDNLEGRLGYVTGAGLSPSGLVFDSSTTVAPPALTASPPFPGTPATSLLDDVPTFGAIALLDTDGDGDEDLLAADSKHSPSYLYSLLQNTSAVLTEAASDAATGYARVRAHQQALHARQVGGVPAIAAGTWETTQAAITARAPHVFASGSTLFPPTTTADPGQDCVGWFTQRLRVADLDGPGGSGHGSRDLVILQGISQLTRALGGDTRGAVALRQIDPGSGALGGLVYLDPTDMGSLPSSCAIADVLSATRASASYTALGADAPVGSPDIVVASPGDSSLTFYLQLKAATWPAPGAPTFTSVKLPMTAISSSIPPGDTTGVAAGDFDGDGDQDLVVVGQLSRTLFLLLQDPDPAAAGSLLTATGGLLPLRVAATLDLVSLGAGEPVVLDATDDGLPDIVVPNSLTSEYRLYVNQGGTPPSFVALRQPMLLPPVPGAVAADFDLDSRTDLALGTTASIVATRQVTPGSLDESFDVVPTSAAPSDVIVADYLGTGEPQLLVTCSGDDRVAVFDRVPGTWPTLLQSIDVSVGGAAIAPRQTWVADATGDGEVDLLTAYTTVIGPGGATSGFGLIDGDSGVASVHTSSGYGGLIGQLAVGDLNEDGRPDVAFPSVLTGGLTTFYGQAGGGFSQTSVSPGDNAYGIEILDLDGDDHLDLVLGSYTQGLLVYYNGGHPAGSLPYGTLPATPTVYAGPAALTLLPCDFDRDGRRDLLGVHTTENEVTLWLQTSARSLTPVSLPTGSGPGYPALGDLNGDGHNDLVVPWGSDDLVAVYYVKPVQTGLDDLFEPPVVYRTSSAPAGVEIVDVDLDGRNDLVVAARGANALNVFYQR